MHTRTRARARLFSPLTLTHLPLQHKFFDGVDFEAIKAHTAIPPSIPDTSRASVHTGEMDLMKLLGGLDPNEEENKPVLTEEQQNLFKDFKYNPYLTNPHKNQIVRTQMRRMSLAPEDNVMLPNGSGQDSEKDDSGDNNIEADTKKSLGGNAVVKKRRGSGSFRKSSSPNNLLLDDLENITEERIDPRTGRAITSENPYNNYDPDNLGNLPKNALTPSHAMGSKKVSTRSGSSKQQAVSDSVK